MSIKTWKSAILVGLLGLLISMSAVAQKPINNIIWQQFLHKYVVTAPSSVNLVKYGKVSRQEQ